MFETSQDLLNIVIAVSVLGLAFFICWAIYYVVMIFRQIFKVVREMRDRLHKMDDFLQSLKEKVEHSTSYLLLISEGVKKMSEILKDRYGNKEKSDSNPE